MRFRLPFLGLLGLALSLVSCANRDTPASAAPASTAPATTYPETTRLPPTQPPAIARPMGTRGGG